MLTHGLLTHATRYLAEILDLNLRPQVLNLTAKLPLAVAGPYEFASAQVWQQRVVLVLPCPQLPSAAQVAAHLAIIAAKAEAPAVLVVEAMAAYERKRLIQQGVAFIVPDRQCYLPFLALDLREHFRSPRPAAVEHLSPTSQCCVLLWLYEGFADLANPTALADRLGLSRMAVGRAFDQLATALADCPGFRIEQQGRRRLASFTGTRQQLWQAIQPQLASPVQRTIWLEPSGVEQLLNDYGDGANGTIAGYALAPLAGLTALARHSMLAEDPSTIIAIRHELWRQLKPQLERYQCPDYSGGICLEIWRYATQLHLLSHTRENADFDQAPAPALLDTFGAYVDPLSLIISLRHEAEHDERITIALEELEKQVFDG